MQQKDLPKKFPFTTRSNIITITIIVTWGIAFGLLLLDGGGKLGLPPWFSSLERVLFALNIYVLGWRDGANRLYKRIIKHEQHS